MIIHKVCSFIGHRKIDVNENFVLKLKLFIKDLIEVKGFRYFLFGSRSEFNDLCYKIVSELKEIYADIKRVFYCCKSETCILEGEKEKWDKVIKKLKDMDISLVFDEMIEYPNILKSGKASYIERNIAMINKSDLCVIYYKEGYSPNTKKSGFLQGKSGTKIAFEYINKKKKNYVNTADFITKDF